VRLVGTLLAKDEAGRHEPLEFFLHLAHGRARSDFAQVEGPAGLPEE
jgi:hypothetical protein